MTTQTEQATQDDAPYFVAPDPLGAIAAALATRAFAEHSFAHAMEEYAKS